jgi:hypothetical protein
MSVTRDHRCFEMLVFICPDHGPTVFAREEFRPDGFDESGGAVSEVREFTRPRPTPRQSGIALQEPESWQPAELVAVSSLRH